MALWVVRRCAVAAGVLFAAGPCASAQTRADQATPAPVEPGPDAPLAPLPGLGVAWPDLSAAPAGSPEATPATVAPADTRYGYRVQGIEQAGDALLVSRFEQLSTLKANAGQPANAAQLDRRAAEDAALLTTLLRAAGYYDARVATRIEPVDGRPLVRLEAQPGVRYTFGGVRIAGLDAAGEQAAALRQAFGVADGQPVDADAIATGEANLRATIARRGFPFAVVGAPQIVVDRAAHVATLDLMVTPGGPRRFGSIVQTGGASIFDARHIREIARFTPGAPYDEGSLVDLRRALVQTGLVSSVDVKPVEGTVPGTVDIAVGMEPAPVHTVAGELGYGTGEGARAEVSWTHRNLFPPEGALTLRGVLGTEEQLAGATFRRSNFRGRDHILTAQATASNLRRNAYQATSFALSASLERQTNIFFQKKWTWSLGGELVASDERDVILDTGAPRRRTYFIGALPTTLTYDGSDDLLDPTRGFRLGGRLSPELSLEGKAFGYTRLQLDASAYKTVTAGSVVAGRIRLGTIVGAPRDAVAPSRRFYAGGGASVRGYGYQDIGPRDPNDAPIGGRSLAEFALEGRVRLFDHFGIVPFLDGGNIYTDAIPRFTDFRYGAGLGLRYYSSFGPIRIDVGTPLNPQRRDPRVAVYVSLGQAF